MIRCRCGVFTNYGLTCSKCALEDWGSKFALNEDPQEGVISLDDILEIEEAAEDDDD
jgi:hypothetical protein